MGKLISPNKVPIIGMLERIPATALASTWTIAADGGFEPEYDGGSTLHWDDQTPGPRDERVAVDEDGGAWLLSACTYLEHDDEPEE